METYPGECTGLVRANDRHGAQRLDSLERLAQNLVLAHHVGADGQTGREGDGEALGDEGDGDRDARNDEGRDVDPVGVSLSQPGGPADVSFRA